MPKALKIIIFIVLLVVFVTLLTIQIKSCVKASALGIEYYSNENYEYDNNTAEVFTDDLAWTFNWGMYVSTANGNNINQHVEVSQQRPFVYKLIIEQSKYALQIYTTESNYSNLFFDSGATATTAYMRYQWTQYPGSPQETVRSERITMYTSFNIIGDVPQEFLNLTYTPQSYCYYSTQYNSIISDNQDGGYYITINFYNKVTQEIIPIKISVKFHENLPSIIDYQYPSLFKNAPRSLQYSYYGLMGSILPVEPVTTPVIFLDNYKVYNAYKVGYNYGYDIGYNYGYDIGYYDGVGNAENGGAVAASFFVSISKILDINIFPNFTIGTLLTFIVGLGILSFVIKFIKG